MFSMLILMIITIGCFIKPITAESKTSADSLRISPWKQNHYMELSAGVGSHLVISSIGWHKMFDVAWKKRFKIGAGIRIGMANSFDRVLTTAPIDRLPSNAFDTLFIPHHSTYSVNLSLHADLSLTTWMDVGFGVDLVGISFGESASARYQASSFSENGTQQTVKPEMLNLLAFSHHNKGSLNNSFYLRFWPGMNLFVKTAFTLYHSAEETAIPLQYGSRYTGYTYMGSISVGWTPFRSIMKKPEKSNP